MGILLFILLIGIVASSFVKGVDAKTASLIRLGLCLFILVLATGRCRSGQTTPAGELAMDRHWLVGWKLGEVLARDCPDGGRLVVMQMQTASGGIRTVNASQLEGLKKGAGKVRFELDMVQREDEAGGNPLGVTDQTLRAMYEASADAVAVVSFVNLPFQRFGRDALPPVYLFDPMGTEYWRDAMKSGMVHAAVVADLPEGKAPPAKIKGKPQDRFDELYRLVTRS